jgi:hypothetical protein
MKLQLVQFSNEKYGVRIYDRSFFGLIQNSVDDGDYVNIDITEQNPTERPLLRSIPADVCQTSNREQAEAVLNIVLAYYRNIRIQRELRKNIKVLKEVEV